MKIIFSTSTVHPRDRIAYWREEACRASVEHEFSTNVGRSFQGQIGAGLLGPFAISILECDECMVERTQHCVQRATDDNLLLCLQIGGRIALHQDGREAVADADDIFLIDPRRPFSLRIQSRTCSLVVKVPREELRARLGDVTALTGRALEGRTPPASLASGFLAMLPAQVDAIDGPTGGKIGHLALDLVALAFAAETESRGAVLPSPRGAALLRVKSTIEARLCEPDLKPAGVAAEAGISIRYANALLAQEGTSTERYIQKRRLERCRRALEDPAQGHRMIGEIAFAWGFSDLSHFGRRFKAAFGVSPGEYRRQNK